VKVSFFKDFQNGLLKSPILPDNLAMFMASIPRELCYNFRGIIPDFTLNLLTSTAPRFDHRK